MEVLKAPPHDAENEKSLLACMLLDEGALNTLLPEITPETFYRQDYALIFKAIQNLYISGKGIDVITISSELQSNSVFEQIGGVSLLAKISTAVATTVNCKHYLKAHLELYNRRKALLFARTIEELAYSGGYSELINGISDIPDFEQEHKDKSTAELLQESVTRIQERYAEPEKNKIGLMTGLSDLDREIGGLKRQDVIFLTAEPNVGKSLLAQQICLKSALDGKTAVYFNFEMDEEYIGDRVLAQALPINAKSIHTPSEFLKDDELELIKTTDIDKRLSNTFFIYTNVTPTIQTIMTKCKQLRAKGKSPDIIAIDYLQMMDGEGNSKMEIVENISKGLKRIARMFKCPVIVISSLSKDKEMRHSYQLRFDADVVIYLSDQKDETALDQDLKAVSATIQKNRNGRVGGEGNLLLSLEYLKFRSRDYANKY